MYIPDAIASANLSRPTTAATGRRRATQARVIQARDEITRHLQQNPVDLDQNARIGPISMNIWSRARAREVAQQEIDGPPQSNPAFRQAMHLDYLRERQSNDPALNEWGELPVRWNNSDPGTFQVHLPTLRRLLGLPNYPLFDREIFHQQRADFPTTVAQDMEDVDHLFD